MYQNCEENRPNEGAPERTDQSTDPNERLEPPQVHSAELFAPFVLSVAYVGLAAAAGPELFDTGSAGITRVVAFALLGLLLHLSGYATAQLYTDARRLGRRDVGWRPNPWHYVCGGALALVGLRAIELVVTGRSVSAPALYLLGNAVVALPLSSIVAAPVYWLNRRRHGDTTG